MFDLSIFSTGNNYISSFSFPLVRNATIFIIRVIFVKLHSWSYQDPFDDPDKVQMIAKAEIWKGR